MTPAAPAPPAAAEGSATAAVPPLNVAIVHPDLGLGGAERLVVDAAVALQAAGHRVTIFTAHHDRARCFEETCDGTVNVRVCGSFLPMHVAQRLRAPCTIARMLYIAGALSTQPQRFDLIFCDLVSHAIPLLKRFTRAPIIFYCHFPDQLLAPRRSGIYRPYRAALDWWEAASTGMADRVLVNSAFTAAAFRQTFAHLHGPTPEVLYPAIDVARYSNVADHHARAADATESALTILALQRFEPQKHIALAIDAFAALRARLPAATGARLRLVIAGGYDERLREHRETLQALQQQARALGVDRHVAFHCSPTERERLALLASCRCVVCTAPREHFGYVPIEAMAAQRPVIAVNSGGPQETIIDGETGLLCAPEPQAFAQAIARLVEEPELAQRWGRAGRAHVTARFSHAVFGRRLTEIVEDVVRCSQRAIAGSTHHGPEGARVPGARP